MRMGLVSQFSSLPFLKIEPNNHSLKIISPLGKLTKLGWFWNYFSKRVSFQTIFGGGLFFQSVLPSLQAKHHVAAWHAFRHWCWRNMLQLFPVWHGSCHWCWRNKLDRVSPVPLAALAKQVQVRKINFACKFKTGVTFDRNVRLRSIICQNARNWTRNPLLNISKGDLIN